MKLITRLLLTALLLKTACLENPPNRESPPQTESRLNIEQNPQTPKKPTSETVRQPNPSHVPQPATTEPKNDTKPSNVKPTPKLNTTDTEPKPVDGFLGPAQCLKKNYTRLSCAKVFCPPWMRCVSGECMCKIPYKCPRLQTNVCGLDGSSYTSMCQAQAISCRSKEAIFSHFSPLCQEKDQIRVQLKVSERHKVVEINTEKGKMLVCGGLWDMSAANIVCRNSNPKGAEIGTKVRYDSLVKTIRWPSQCVNVQCTGSELSLAECSIHKPKLLNDTSEVAVANCYKEPAGECKMFLCVNGKCINHSRTCNGVDDCGDNSDEMCCQRCRGDAFRCSSGVCIPRHAVRDQIRDCLGGDDESEEMSLQKKRPTTDDLLSDPKSEIRSIRTAAEGELQCGIPNMDYVDRTEDTPPHQRKKRLVGGQETLPTQIQWQVAVQDEGNIHCGGVYLGRCWVLTAAHCVRPKPKSFRIKISLWQKHRRLSTTDSIPVKKIIIHHQYNAGTYENDIALMQLEQFKNEEKCMHDNPAVRAVCVPWSTELFQPNDTCTISGWGRNREGVSASVLKWANVSIISDCEKYYKNRFLPGMECAGDLEGKVDSCQGDSGGPLVCKDASGVSYVWGIVSWGDKCGEANHPGVYTKVAHYFEWIRFQTGWPAVTKYNQ
ncbi:complement factor I [Triplophysa dalaica]|uniref:complement factor I n=1 Tax=Triplophysa dalaica TaxID=1582913 RepID=UPI0024DF37F4|nr:complement factor I [Triplophysa dalaica]